jgi:hypothetical protein
VDFSSWWEAILRDGDNGGLDATPRIPASHPQDGNSLKGNPLNPRPQALPGRTVGEHIEYGVPAGPQINAEADQRPQQILGGKQVVQGIEVAGDEVYRLRKL